jgi:ubiquinone/menaquinone biosynthesis C-methylase UbiE
LAGGAVDSFSTKSKEYSFSRPTYPEALFKFLSELAPQRNLAWDCATGNGQAAIELCKHFKRVIASDASENQIRHSFNRENIDYRVFPAEETPLGDDSVDLVAVAQAVHWFDFDRFYSEVRRVGKKGGIIAVWSYDMHRIQPEIDRISGRLDFGGDILGEFWPKEIRHVKEHYRTIPFPFKEVAAPELKIETRWNLYQLVNYMETWSSVKKYQLEKKSNPLELIRGELKNIWGDPQKQKPVVWKLSIRAGVIK